MAGTVGRHKAMMPELMPAVVTHLKEKLRHQQPLTEKVLLQHLGDSEDSISIHPWNHGFSPRNAREIRV
jgi:hypothetical protein